MVFVAKCLTGFAALCLLVATPAIQPASAADKLGARAVSGFAKNCLVGRTTVDRLAAGFRRSGWRRGSSADKKAIKRVLSLARSAMRNKGRMEVFGHGGGRSRLVAVVSRTSPTFPGVGCYVYAPGAHYASAEAALAARIKAKPTHKRTLKGAARQIEWRGRAARSGHVAVKYVYAVPGGRVARDIGMSGVVLATTITPKK